MGQVQDHSSMYASNKRYERVKTDRDYWKARALEEQKIARSDGLWTGVIFTLGAVVIIAIVLWVATA